MSERIEISCPCCQTRLVIDTASGEILSEERPKAGGKSFESALAEVQGGSKKREQAFSKAFDRTRNLDDLLQKKFEEAKKKTSDDGAPPVNPLDLD